MEIVRQGSRRWLIVRGEDTNSDANSHIIYIGGLRYNYVFHICRVTENGGCVTGQAQTFDEALQKVKQLIAESRF